jgi:hypothetical protein
VDENLETTTTRCRDALASVADERSFERSSHGVAIEAVTGMNWRSFGTVVRIELAPSHGGTDLRLVTWPGSQLFDWGESRRLADSLTSELSADAALTSLRGSFPHAGAGVRHRANCLGERQRSLMETAEGADSDG